MRNFSTICQNKSSNKKRNRSSFSILFAVIVLYLKLFENTDQMSESHFSVASAPFEVRFGTVNGKLMLFNIIEDSKTSWTNFRDKLQFVNSVKRLVFN